MKQAQFNLIKVSALLLALTMLCGCGRKGDDGATGAQGAAGPRGPAGADGQPAKVVQLCPGINSYPGVFTEVALLINGSLFAVYSDHGGFLTELTPGRYSSNAIGSACNFTVNADATITN